MTEQQVIEWLSQRDQFLILTHIRPDGDTLGSAAALCLALRKQGKTAYLLSNPGVTAQYRDYLTFHWAPEDYQPHYVVAVDIATEGLFPEGEHQHYLGKTDLCIDHHPSNTHYAPALCLDASAAACGEIVYQICRGLGPLDRDIAQALYLAISTDCGCFAYSNTTPRTHRIAAELMEYGDFYPVNKRFFQTKSRKELQLQAMLMASESFYEEGQICIGTIAAADRDRIGAQDSDCSELASFAASIEGVRCAATLRELEPGLCKLSIRSDAHYVDANQVCQRMGGGGHPAASGATLSGVTLEEARKVVYDSIQAVLRGHNPQDPQP